MSECPFSRDAGQIYFDDFGLLFETSTVVMLLLVCCVGLLTAVSGDETDGLFRAQDLSKMSDREIMEHLVATVNTQQKRIDGLEESLTKQNDVIRQQNDVIRELQKKLKDDETVPERTVEDESSNSGSDELPRQRVAKPKHRSSRMSPRLVSGTPVAFSALASHDLEHLGANQNLIMEVVNVNSNNVYNPHHGVFTAPVSGVYVITSTVLADQNREVWCDVVVDGIVKASIYARGTDNRHDMGSQTILLHLKQGDDVSIRNQALDDAVYGSLYTSFAGFLLYEEDTGPIVG